MAVTWVLPVGTSGAAGTLANEGGFTTLNAGGFHTLQSAAAYPGRGVGVQYAAPASTLTSSRLTFGSTGLNYSERITVTTPSATPSVDSTLHTIRHASGVIFRVIYTTAGVLGVSTSTGSVVTLKTGAGLSTQYDVTILLALDSAAGTTGSYTAKAYTPGTTTQQGSTATLSGSAALGTSAVAAIDVGMTTATSTVAVNVGFGALGYEVGSTTEVPPYAAAANVAPTITGPGSINTTGSTASLTFNGNDTDGTISSFALVNQSNTANTTITPTIGTGAVTGAGSANASVTFPVSGLTANAKYFFGGTATDNNGAVSTTSVATVNVTKDIPDIRSVVTTGFTVVGGGTATDAIVAGNAQAAAGQTVTRYLESTAPPGGATCTITFQPITPSTVARQFTFPVKAKDTTSTETATVSLLMNDNTTIATRGPITLTTTAAGCGGTTTLGAGSETTAITDYSKLAIKVVTN